MSVLDVISTPLREGRPLDLPDRAKVAMFQSTPLCEGRRDQRDHAHPADRRFNPRPSVRGDIARGARAYVCNGFNPRPSVRGDFGRK